MTHHSKKLKISLISVLLVLGLATGPVQASHNHNVLAPLAAFVVLGSLLRHNHGHDYHYSKRRYGHYGHNGHNGNMHNRRARSHSFEGRNRNFKRIVRH